MMIISSYKKIENHIEIVNEVGCMENETQKTSQKDEISISIAFSDKGSTFQEVMGAILLNKLLGIK